ncbi:hypothetical protein BB560_003439 [Smittium megazygosporum]|uniref:Tr-type G domain-containing protein n=1 Tax=Smittium megazygosporum TaxID=133381 RepID=A0A2T9ZC56_9FUNG|nr:hypothetical protein BB560_003439 [Smittium megazygosporum]
MLKIPSTAHYLKTNTFGYAKKFHNVSRNLLSKASLAHLNNNYVLSRSKPSNRFANYNQIDSLGSRLCLSQQYSSKPIQVIHDNDKNNLDLTEFETDSIRNFSIIAHIDHGKSTLADRLLELTGTISKETKNLQVLDKLPVERQRGITVKAQSASMFYNYKGKKYLLNLIDTPGHVDFNYEVSRSLAACQGTVLLVDSAQGIQAQTVANFYLAFSQNLTVIPVLNKIDLPGADIPKVENQINNTFEFEKDQILNISAKTGINIDQILPAIIERIPQPSGRRDGPFKALLFDSWYDTYVGVICLISIEGGSIKRGDKIISAHTGVSYDVMQVGIMSPEMKKFSGQVGYVVCNMKSISEAHVGDTFFHQNHPVKPFPGFRQPKPMVFAGLFPADSNEYSKLQDAINQLTLNDSSVTVFRETSAALGQGWRLGFLGTLHMDVFKQRLEEEYGIDVILSHPTVPYKCEKELIIKSPEDFPDRSKIKGDSTLFEPMVSATIITPKEYLGSILNLCSYHRGALSSNTFIDETRVMVSVKLPMSEIVTDFYDKMKSLSSGFASLDYEDAGYEESDLVKMEVLVNSKTVDALASVMHKSKVDLIGREYGGDVTRKMKLLNKQKEGKKRMKAIGQVEIPHEAFISLMTKSESK